MGEQREHSGSRTRTIILFAALLSAVAAQERTYTLAGAIVPAPAAGVVIALHGATSAYSASATAGPDGKFRFRRLHPGAYTISAIVPEYGELRRTVEVGPSLADSKGVVTIVLPAASSGDLKPGRTVSAAALSIPSRAWREYEKAQQCLERRDVPAAVAHLERAVRIAPRFAQAWNTLGTVAYHGREYEKAERHFREALAQDPAAYEPLVNLGGVLLNLGKPREALEYNARAVEARPLDALAQSQLGMTYFLLENLALAKKHLEEARRLDPSHFSHPQLTLADIHLRQNNSEAAGRELEEFLRLHPDSPDAARIRSLISGVRGQVRKQ